MGAMLRPEAMLVRVQKTMCMPDLLDPRGHHARPEFSDDFKKRDWTNFREIMYPWFLREESHEAVLPPLRNMVVCPHD